MITRKHFRRNWSAIPGGIATPAANSWQRGRIWRGGPISLHVPPRAVEMDPSDRSTWRKPVRFT